MSEERKTLTEDEIRVRLEKLSAEHKALKDEFGVISSEYAEALGEINQRFDERRLPVQTAISRVTNQIAEVQHLCPRYPHKPTMGPRMMRFLLDCPICGAKPL